MSSHFSDIGFPANGSELWETYGESGLEQGTRIETAQGTYVRWQCGLGVEIWFQLFGENRVNMNPHFAGETRIKARLTKSLQRPTDPPLDGAFHGIARTDITDKSWDVPFVFDAPDFLIHQEEVLSDSEDRPIQLAAFMHTLTIWPDEQAFLEQHDGERKLSPLSYFPVGLPGEANPHPVSVADFGGIIERCVFLTNPITGSEFWWAQARTLIGSIDIVADPSDLPGEIETGNVFWGNFYISGLIF
jgi:hypothetical protein